MAESYNHLRRPGPTRSKLVILVNLSGPGSVRQRVFEIFILKSFGRRLLKRFRRRCRLSRIFRQFKKFRRRLIKIEQNIQITLSIHSLAMREIARESESNVAMLIGVRRARIRPASCLPRSLVTAAAFLARNAPKNMRLSSQQHLHRRQNADIVQSRRQTQH